VLLINYRTFALVNYCLHKNSIILFTREPDQKENFFALRGAENLFVESSEAIFKNYKKEINVLGMGT
jgi:hypothetical protein